MFLGFTYLQEHKYSQGISEFEKIREPATGGGPEVSQGWPTPTRLPEGQRTRVFFSSSSLQKGRADP
jgi:hypothetical protein